MGFIENETSCLGSQSSYQYLWDQNVPPSPPYFCQELFRSSGKIQVRGAVEATMKKFLIIWEVGNVYVRRANDVGPSTCRENCLE